MPEPHDRPLKMLIEQYGHTQSSLARALNVPVPQVNKWCRRGDPNTESLVRIADALGCTIDAILGRTLEKVTTLDLMNELRRRTGS